MFPAEALARVLGERGWRVVLATDHRGDRYAQAFPAEERLALDAATFRLGDLLGMARAGVRIAGGVRRARAAFRRLDPAIVVGFGGYPSLPALLASSLGRIPALLHEQNAVLGRVNRLMARRVQVVACAFPTLRLTPAGVSPVVVGNPLRPEIRALFDRPYRPSGERLTLLITGGSQGARVLAETAPAAVARLPEAVRVRLRVVQQTRAEQLEPARAAYARAGVEAELAPFYHDMAARLGEADLVIGRAGASTVCELAVAGKPSILVPLRIAADDHQSDNARLLSEAGAAEVIAEARCTPETLAETLEALLTDRPGLRRRAEAARSVATPDAGERLADLVERTARA